MNKLTTSILVLALAGTAACNRSGAATNSGANKSANSGATQNSAIAPPATPTPAGAAELRALLDQVYAPYAAANAPTRDIAQFMEPQLAQKMNATEEGMDFDPFLDAQDYAPFRPEYQSVTVNGDRAQAVVRINSMGQRVINYQFLRTPAGWKIADVGTERSGTLRGRYDLPPME